MIETEDRERLKRRHTEKDRKGHVLYRCVFVCCVCVRNRKREREREKERVDRERAGERLHCPLHTHFKSLPV